MTQIFEGKEGFPPQSDQVVTDQAQFPMQPAVTEGPDTSGSFLNTEPGFQPFAGDVVLPPPPPGFVTTSEKPRGFGDKLKSHPFLVAGLGGLAALTAVLGFSRLAGGGDEPSREPSTVIAGSNNAEPVTMGTAPRATLPTSTTVRPSTTVAPTVTTQPKFEGPIAVEPGPSSVPESKDEIYCAQVGPTEDALASLALAGTGGETLDQAGDPLRALAPNSEVLDMTNRWIATFEERAAISVDPSLSVAQRDQAVAEWEVEDYLPPFTAIYNFCDDYNS